jgi:hypothetical protein
MNDRWTVQLPPQTYRAEAEHTSAGRAYQWKRLFLPAATKLRMSFGGKCHFTEVDGDEIMLQGESHSPLAPARNSFRVDKRGPGHDL